MANADNETTAKEYGASNVDAVEKANACRHCGRGVVNEFQLGKGIGLHAGAAELAKVRAALSFAASVIKSGEPWSKECERIILGNLSTGNASGPTSTETPS